MGVARPYVLQRESGPHLSFTPSKTNADFAVSAVARGRGACIPNPKRLANKHEGLPRGCALAGVFPFNPVVLELHACRYFAQVAPSPSAPLQNLNEAPLRGVAL